MRKCIDCFNLRAKIPLGKDGLINFHKIKRVWCRGAFSSCYKFGLYFYCFTFASLNIFFRIDDPSVILMSIGK